MVYSNRKQLFSKSWREKQKKLFYRNSVTVINKFCALCRHASNSGVKKYSLDFPFVSGWRSRVNYWFCFFALHSFIRLLPSTCHADHAFYTSRFNLLYTLIGWQSSRINLFLYSHWSWQSSRLNPLYSHWLTIL